MGIMKWLLREITERAHGRAPLSRPPAALPGSSLNVRVQMPGR